MSWYSVIYLKMSTETFGEERFSNKHEALRFISRLSSDSVSLQFNSENLDGNKATLGTWFDGTNNVSVLELESSLKNIETQTV